MNQSYGKIVVHLQKKTWRLLILILAGRSSRSIVCVLSIIQHFNLHVLTIPAANVGTQLFSSTI